VNQLKFVATIAEKSALRYTPAGIPIATAVLMHSSEQTQAGTQRQIEFEISAIAAGDISKKISGNRIANCFGIHRFFGA